MCYVLPTQSNSKISIGHRLSYTQLATKAWRIRSTFCCDPCCVTPARPNHLGSKSMIFHRNKVYGVKLLPVWTDLTTRPLMMWYTIVKLTEIYQHVIGTCFCLSKYESNRCSLTFVNFNQPMQHNNQAALFLVVTAGRALDSLNIYVSLMQISLHKLQLICIKSIISWQAYC